MVTVSQACQREWCDVADGWSRGAQLYLLIAEAIGCERTLRETNSLGRLKRSGEPNAIVESTESAWKTHGLNKKQASALTRKYSWGARDTPPSSMSHKVPFYGIAQSVLIVNQIQLLR